MRIYFFALKRVAIGFIVLALIMGALHFPRDTDAPLSAQEIDDAKKYYAELYQQPVKHTPANESETKYGDIGRV
ncbi:MAG TPA: hypothetical protein VJQ55_09780, partial [Candidatus Binatia bacterium]|nr:hypothetical protein [Candidatus Binatia bacterium]